MVPHLHFPNAPPVGPLAIGFAVLPVLQKGFLQVVSLVSPAVKPHEQFIVLALNHGTGWVVSSVSEQHPCPKQDGRMDIRGIPKEIPALRGLRHGFDAPDAVGIHQFRKGTHPLIL